MHLFVRLALNFESSFYLADTSHYAIFYGPIHRDMSSLYRLRVLGLSSETSSVDPNDRFRDNRPEASELSAFLLLHLVTCCTYLLSNLPLML